MINLMKTRNIYSLLYVTFVAVMLVACNDYDAAQTAYEEIVDSDVTTTPPNIDSAWELQLIPNVGQHSGEVFVYKAIYSHIGMEWWNWCAIYIIV